MRSHHLRPWSPPSRRPAPAVIAIALTLAACAPDGSTAPPTATSAAQDERAVAASATESDRALAPSPPPSGRSWALAGPATDANIEAGAQQRVGVERSSPAPADDVRHITVARDRNWGVIGVRADSALNVRSAPGVGSPVVGSLHPVLTGVRTTGRARTLGDAVWLEIDHEGIVGWVHTRHLAPVGETSALPELWVDGHNGAIHGVTVDETVRSAVAAWYREDYLDRYEHDIAPRWTPMSADGDGSDRFAVVSGGPHPGVTSLGPHTISVQTVTVDVTGQLGEGLAAERLTLIIASEAEVQSAIGVSPSGPPGGISRDAYLMDGALRSFCAPVWDAAEKETPC